MGVVAGLIAMKTADTRSFVATTMLRSIAAVSVLQFMTIGPDATIMGCISQ
jgi:hypothetical protein